MSMKSPTCWATSRVRIESGFLWMASISKKHQVPAVHDRHGEKVV